MKKILAVLIFVAMTGSVAAFEEIECSTDAVFQENSCNQCFTGGSKDQGDNVGLLSDDWLNVTTVDKILYKEEQKMPTMVNLDSANVTWSQNPDDNSKFWGYTDEFNALYDENQEGYVLEAGKTVTWIKSLLSSVYTLEKNSASADANIGLLVYPIAIHDIDENGDIALEATQHNECVLFKSNAASDAPVVEEPKRLPETGPAEYILLLLMAMILGFGVMKVTRKS